MRPNHSRLETATRAAALGQAAAFRQGTVEPPPCQSRSPVPIGSPAARPMCPRPWATEIGLHFLHRFWAICRVAADLAIFGVREISGYRLQVHGATMPWSVIPRSSIPLLSRTSHGIVGLRGDVTGTHLSRMCPT